MNETNMLLLNCDVKLSMYIAHVCLIKQNYVLSMYGQYEQTISWSNTDILKTAL